jgi:hypothetical protein
VKALNEHCCKCDQRNPVSRLFFRAAALLTLVGSLAPGRLVNVAQAVPVPDWTNLNGTTIVEKDLFFGEMVNATNAGIITGSNLGIYLSVFTLTNLVNTGTTHATDKAVWCFMSSVTVLDNSGTISGDYGVFLTDGIISTVTNSGTINGTTTGIIQLNSHVVIDMTNTATGIISGGAHAIDNQGNIVTLTLAAGSQLTGGIYNSGNITTLTIESGAHISGAIQNDGTIGTLNAAITTALGNFDLTASSAGILGNAPAVMHLTVTAPSNVHIVNATNHAVGIDRTAATATSTLTKSYSNAISRLISSDRIASGIMDSIASKTTKAAAIADGLTSDLCIDGTPISPPADGREFWIRGFQGRNSADATGLSTGYLNTYYGGAVGVERDFAGDLRGGAFIGTGKAETTIDGGLGGSSSTLIFGGAFATRTWGTNFLKAAVTGGHGSNKGTRIIGGGAETALADYGSWYVSPELTAGRVFDVSSALGTGFTLTPVLSLRYIYGAQSAYTETGATSPLSIAKHSSSTTEERLELKLGHATSLKGCEVRASLSVGAIAQQNSDGNVSGTVLGTPINYAVPGKNNDAGFVAGLSAEISRGRYSFSLSGDYVKLSGGNADLSTNAVFRVRF